MPGVPKIFCDKGSSFFDALKTAPKLVKIFVRNINGKSPGKTEKKNSLTPLIVPLENKLGLQIITTIIKKTKAERQRSLKSFERLKVKNILFFA